MATVKAIVHVQVRPGREEDPWFDPRENGACRLYVDDIRISAEAKVEAETNVVMMGLPDVMREPSFSVSLMHAFTYKDIQTTLKSA